MTITKENWKDFVCYQPVNKVNDGEPKFSLLYLYVRYDNASNVEVVIDRHEFTLEQLTLTEDELVDTINRELQSFSTKVQVSEEESQGFIDLHRAKNDVAKKTRRGQANTNIGNIWFYKGSQGIDGPLIVAEYENRFYLFKHHKFDDYGFIVE